MLYTILTFAFMIGVFVFIAWMFISKWREEPLQWPDLASVGEPTEMWVDGMDDLENFPQYGYHRYRDVYLNMKRLPIIITYPENIDGLLAYHFVYVTNGEEGMDLPSAIMKLGIEKPAEIKKF